MQGSGPRIGKAARRSWAGAVAVAAFASLATADEAKLKSYGRHLAQECASCHRIDGTDNGIPSITGWPADKFVATVKFYQEGARANPVMVSVAKSLNEQQLEALATFFASLPQPAKGSRTK